MLGLVSTLLFHTRALGSDFFDTNSYDPSDPCYNEFFKLKDKDAWAKCCQSHRHSDNCDDKYYPSDICYPYMEVGDQAIWGGLDHNYANEKWGECCEANCGDLTLCRSSYCKDWADDVENFFEYWGVIILSIVGVLLTVCLIVVLICCGCCGCCGCAACLRKKKMKETQNLDIEGGVKAINFNAVPEHPSAQQQPIYDNYYTQPPPHIVHLVQESSSSSDDEKIVVVRHEVHQV